MAIVTPVWIESDQLLCMGRGERRGRGGGCMPDAVGPLLAITMGDPAGIGPEVVLKALAITDIIERCRPLVIGAGG